MPLDPAYRDSIRQKYQSISEVWDDQDRWHARSKYEIKLAVERLNKVHPLPFLTTIDIGSAGYAQPVITDRYVHVDVTTRRLHNLRWSICADAQSLPFSGNSADCIICVGPVVNYCSLIDVVAEFSRVCAPGGYLLLHIELSNSLEFIATPHFRSRAAFVKTFYQGDEKLWVYSNSGVRGTLSNAGFRIVDDRYFHIASALAYRLSRASDWAAKFAIFDRILSKVPGIGGVSDSALFICEKSI